MAIVGYCQLVTFTMFWQCWRPDSHNVCQSVIDQCHCSLFCKVNNTLPWIRHDLFFTFVGNCRKDIFWSSLWSVYSCNCTGGQRFSNLASIVRLVSVPWYAEKIYGHLLEIVNDQGTKSLLWDAHGMCILH